VKTDLIIGGASNYTWDHIKYWVNSIRRTSFVGDIVLVVTNMNEETIAKIRTESINLYCYGNLTDNGLVHNSKNAPHVERFFYIREYLKSNKHYRYVTVTDTRDVIFQSDPNVFLEKNMSGREIIASSEGMVYKDEPWNNQNMREAFGNFMHNEFKEYDICNAGVIAGRYDAITDFLLILYEQCINRPIPIVDQAVFNFLINQRPFKNGVLVTKNDSAWAAQLGVTRGAIEAGAGEIGISVQQNPALLSEYIDLYKDNQPIIDGPFVVNQNGQKFCIVHQWDRIPLLKKEIEEYYEDLSI
jgi:hypothetical protein